MARQQEEGADYLALDGRDSASPLFRGRAGPEVRGVLSTLVLVGIAFLAGFRTASVTAEPRTSVVEKAALEEPLWKPRLLPVFYEEPIAKSTVRRLDAFLINQAAFETPENKLRNVEQWLAPDFLYDTVGFGTSLTPRGWCVQGEESQFRRTFNNSASNQMLFFGDDRFSTTTSYLTVFWALAFKGVPASLRWTYFRVTDFYLVRQTGPGRGQIYYNFMMIDYIDLFNRNGIRMLPKPVLPEGLVLTAIANDGTPAPLSVTAKYQDMATAQRVSAKALQEDWAGEGAQPNLALWHSNLTFYGPGGIGLARGKDQYRDHVLKPFWEAFAERSVNVNISGCEGDYCGTFGELRGRHVGSWLGLEASGRHLAVRFAFHYHVLNGRVHEGWAVFDVPGLYQQVGKDFFALVAAKALALDPAWAESQNLPGARAQAA